MSFQVIKFGGTSMGSTTSLQNVSNIISKKTQNRDQLIVVVSAMSGVTDKLLELAKEAKDKNLNVETFDLIKQKHREVLDSFDIKIESTGLNILFNELWEVLTYATLIEETSRIIYFDLVASFGERLSANLLNIILTKLGQSSEFLDTRKVLVTDSNFSNASLNWLETETNWNQLKPEIKSAVIITTGFIARSNEGATTTLGRGGSDFTAGVMANLTNAKSVEIWTDVDGILSTDPRIVENTRLIESMSYREAFEVAYYGGKVLYPKTIEACMPKNIEIVIKNTFHPENIPTKIVAEETKGLKVVSLAKKITIVEVVFAAITSEIGLLGRIFSEFAKENLSVDVVTTSGDSVSFSCNRMPPEGLINKIESEIGPVTVWENQEIVATIGAKLNEHKDFTTVLEMVNSSNPKMISMNTKNTNLTAVVDAGQGANLVKEIHKLIVS